MVNLIKNWCNNFFRRFIIRTTEISDDDKRELGKEVIRIVDEKLKIRDSTNYTFTIPQVMEKIQGLANEIIFTAFIIILFNNKIFDKNLFQIAIKIYVSILIIGVGCIFFKEFRIDLKKMLIKIIKFIVKMLIVPVLLVSILFVLVWFDTIDFKNYQNSTGTFKVMIELGRNDDNDIKYLVDEPIKLGVLSGKGGYIYIFQIDNLRNKVVQLLPNAYLTDCDNNPLKVQPIKAEDMLNLYQICGNPMKRAFKAQKPEGTYYIKALITESVIPFIKYEFLPDQKYVSISKYTRLRLYAWIFCHGGTFSDSKKIIIHSNPIY